PQTDALPALSISRSLRTATIGSTRGPHQFLTGCASARGRVSKTQPTPGGTEAACHFHFGVVADKQCTCPASKFMWERYPPTPPISTAGNSTNAQREAS